MASREQQNYENTKNFLYSHRSYKIANLGYTCLELKDRLGPFLHDQPWSVDITLNRDRDSRYQWAAILAQDAATKAHFYLMAANAPTRHLVYGQLRFLVICDIGELEMALQRVVSFLQNLEHYLAVNRLNQAIDNQAKDLVDDLKKLIVLKLDDFPINQNALDLFSPVIRTGQNPMPYRHLVTVDSICICVGNGQPWINGS
ncbi:hypothetical protein EV368DRAFT_67671 [Lentinula lateritia]|nr:hypothetical protein EV368DRAFT_67671 [Lentinula lateritia]